jgi:hypothetical protein
VVAAREVAEVSLAGRVVADGGLVVGLQQARVTLVSGMQRGASTGLGYAGTHTFQCFRVGAPVGFGNWSRFQLLSTDLELSPVDRLLSRPNALKPPRLMKLPLGRKSSSAASLSSSSFGRIVGSLDGNCVGRSTAGTYRGPRLWEV